MTDRLAESKQASHQFTETLMMIHNKFYRQTRVPLPINQYGVLFTLAVEKAASITEIGRTLNIAKQQMTTIIGKLETAGYVRREADPQDRRRSIIHLTQKGEDLLNAQNAIVDRMFTDGLKHLSDNEAQTLQHAIAVINTLIEKMPPISAYES